MDDHRHSLPPEYKLHWYHIQKILGHGGFGITYLALDTNLNQWVAIKEYLPSELAMREETILVHPVSSKQKEQFEWGLEKFISEAQTLARFKHPNIIRVLTVFRENNTAYMVMEYERGRGLNEILKKEKTLDEDILKQIALPILDGLEAIHKENFIHRDIKPSNIYIREDNSPVLLDFGSARQSLDHQTRTLTTMVSPGYAPFEQYVSKSKSQGPWTDVYGMAATLYRSVTGVGPSDSMDRSEAILHTGKDSLVPASEIAGENYSAGFLAAIDHALAFKPEDRPQSVADWRKELTGEHTPDFNLFENTTSPVITLTDEEHEATTQILPNDIETVKSKPPIAVNVPHGGSFFARLLNSAYRLIKRLLKWILVLLLIFVLLSILSNWHKKRSEPALESPSGTSEKSSSVPQDRHDTAKITGLLQAAEDDINTLRLTSPIGNNALEKYNKVLSLQPNNQAALDGKDRIIEEYIHLMDKEIAEGNLVKAEYYLNRATPINPQFPALAPARSRLIRAREEQKARQEQKAQDAMKKQEAAQSRVPEQERQLLQSLREKLKANPNDVIARRQLRKLAERFEGNIKQAIEKKDYELAKDYIYEIQSVVRNNPKSAKRMEELLRKIEERQRLELR